MNKKEERRKKAREYYHKNKERINATRSTPQRLKERQTRQNKLRRRRRMEVINFFGGVCVRCGFDDWRALQIDHIEGGGTAERKSFRYYDTLQYQRHVMSNKKKYQLLCANCNWIKRYENHEERKII